MTNRPPQNDASVTAGKTHWYSGVTSYQWLILVIASAGWIFDAFEGQLFNITRNQLLADILGEKATDAAIKNYGDVFLAVFLTGGTLGGLLFGSLADRWGRKPVMAVTILMYSLFSGLTFFAHTLWEVGATRFLVAMGVGGEWAVAASLVAEVFPKQARAQASGIFHATSVLGVWASAFTGWAVGAQWRYAYLISLIPALLVFWVMISVKEPESWRAAGARAANATGPKLGRFRDLFGDRRWRSRAVLGMLLAAVGLGTFWGVTVAGQDLVREMLLREGMGPLCVRLGRRRAFAFMQIAAFVIVPITCYLPSTYVQLLLLLPLFGFLTGGMHSGYAIYFPELFPNHLRATGTGFCFNGGRIVAASVLVLSGWLKSLPHMDLRFAATLLGTLFLLGVVVILFMPETKDQPLPE